MIIELDGNSHDDRTERDANRDATLEETGWTTLRVRNVDVRDHPNDLWDEIEKQIRAARRGTTCALPSS